VRRNCAPYDDDADLERAEAGGGQVVHGASGGGERAFAAHRVVGGGGGSVNAHLNVEIVHGRQLAGPRRGDPGAVGGELDAHAAVDGVADQIEEVGPQHGLPAADVDVEDLHGREVVDHPSRLRRGQFARIASAGGTQAVDAGKVAGVGQLPGQTDRCIEAAGELLFQR